MSNQFHHTNSMSNLAKADINKQELIKITGHS